MRPLSRREFLRASSASALGLIAVACGGNGSKGSGSKTLNDVIGGRPQSVQVISAGFETFSGTLQRVVFGLIDPSTGQPMNGGAGRAWTSLERDTEALGPFDLTFRGEGLGARGVFVAQMTFPTDGTYLIVIEATPQGGGDALLGATQLVVGPATNMPKPGDEAILVATPTFDDPRGVDPICTLEPPCSMHAQSLDAVLGKDTPTVVIIATPRFCTSALCGPEVEIVDEVSKAFSERVNFVHIELLKDDSNETAEQWAQNPTPALFSPGASEWRVEQEPVIYFIDGSGTITDRVIGPFDRAEAREKVEGLAGA